MNHFVVDYLKKRYDLRDEIILPWVIIRSPKANPASMKSLGKWKSSRILLSVCSLILGQTDIRVTAKAPSAAEAEAMMAPVLQEIREKLKDYIYGENETTLEKPSQICSTKPAHACQSSKSGTSGTIYGKLRALCRKIISAATVDLVFRKRRSTD